MAWAGTGIYCASKFALEGLGETLAQELAPLGISVTNVAPGGLRTDYAARSMTVTEAAISDYADTAHLSRRLLDAGATLVTEMPSGASSWARVSPRPSRANLEAQ